MRWTAFALQDSTLADLNQKLQTLKDQTIGRLMGLELPPQAMDRITDLTSNIEGFEIPVAATASRCPRRRPRDDKPDRTRRWPSRGRRAPSSPAAGS